MKTKILLKGKPGPDDDPVFNEQLAAYMEGNRVTEKWISAVTSRRGRVHPTKLYRLCLTSRKPEPGSIIKVSKHWSLPRTGAITQSMQAVHTTMTVTQFLHEKL